MAILIVEIELSLTGRTGNCRRVSHSAHAEDFSQISRPVVELDEVLEYRADNFSYIEGKFWSDSRKRSLTIIYHLMSFISSPGDVLV